MVDSSVQRIVEGGNILCNASLKIFFVYDEDAALWRFVDAPSLRLHFDLMWPIQGTYLADERFKHVVRATHIDRIRFDIYPT